MANRGKQRCALTVDDRKLARLARLGAETPTLVGRLSSSRKVLQDALVLGEQGRSAADQA